ncbi:MAG: hypothetical protein AB1696_28035, partial [Planctomycetota bacterium]
MDSGQVISIVLKRLRNRVKLVDLGAGFIALAAFLVIFLLLEVVFDHVFVLQKATRLVSLSILKVSVFLLACASILFPLLRHIRDLYCAKLIEDVYPDLKNSLTSYLQVKDDPETPPDALQVLKHKTAKHLVHVRPAVVVSTRRFIYAGYLLIAAMIVSFTYSILSPKNVVPSLKRSLFPERDIDPPTKTVIASVQPGKNTPRVLEHSPAQIFVKTAGQSPDGVSVRWRERGGEWWSKGLEPAGEHRWRGGIETVGKGVEYFIAAGDTKSDMFRIKTVPRPIVQKVEVEVDDDPNSPGPARRSEGGDISAATHSLATVKATTNHRLHSAALVTESGRRVEMTVGPDGRTPAAKISVERDDKYRIEVVDEYSHKNENPPTYVITCWEGQAAEREKATETAGVQKQSPDRKIAKDQPTRKADASEMAALVQENQNRLAKIAAALEKRREQQSDTSQQNKGARRTEGQGKAKAEARPGKG